MRSLNGNVFVYSSYWGKVSRILFHDPGGPASDRMRQAYEIPKHHTDIEVDVTAINPHSVLHWEDRVQHANIRSHGTTRDAKDEIFGSLPDGSQDWMTHWLMPETIHKLLHSDFLAFIDYDKYQALCNGGVRFNDMVRDPFTPREFEKRLASKSPLLFGCADYEAYRRIYRLALSSMITEPGLRTQKPPDHRH